MADAPGGMEVESLYVSFGGDGSGYEKMLDGAVDDTKKASTETVKILSDAAKQIEQEFQAQAKTFSMTAREAQIFRLQMQGATDEQVKGARAANDVLTTLEKEQAEFEKFQAMRDQVKLFTNDLQAQSRTFGMTARQVEIYRLSVAGATKEEVKAMQAADRRLTKLEAQSAAYARGKSIMEGMRNSSEKYADTLGELNDLLKAGAIDAETYKRAVAEAKKTVGTGWDKVAAAMNPVNSAAMQIGRNIQNIGRSYTMYVSAPIAAFGALSVREFGKFENAMTGAFAIMGDIDDTMKGRLSKTVRDMSASRKTSFGPDELAGGLKNLAAAGLSAEQSMASLTVVERFATAGAFGLDRASQLLLDSQSALGMVEKDAIKNKENLLKVSDALIKAGDQSTASPEQFAEALANGAADAKNFGMELHTTMAVLDAYASKGNKGAAAGSDLARATRLISKAVREHGEVFEKLGIDPVNKATGEYKNFIEIVADMEQAFKGLTGPERAAMLELMGFEALAQSAILPLIGMSDQMKIWEKEQRSATDYTKNTAEKQMKSFTNEMLALWGQLKEVGIGIGEYLVPYIRMMSNSLSTTLGYWKELPGPIQAVAIAGAGLIAVIGPLLVLFGTGVIVAGSFSSAMTALGMSFTFSAAASRAWAIASPVGLMLATAAAAYALGRAIDLNIGYTAHWNAELKEAVELHSKLSAKMDEIATKRNDAVINRANSMNDGDKRKFLTEQITVADKNVAGLAGQVAGARKRVDELTTAWSTFVDPYILETAKKELLEVEHNLDVTRTRATKLKDALSAMGPEGAAGLAGASNAVKPLGIEIDALNKKLEEQIATFKDSTEEAKIYELRLAGATEKELATAVALNLKLKELKKVQKEKEQMAKFDEDLKRLQAEEAMFGKGQRAIEIYKMKLDGASDAQIAQATAIDATLTRLESEKKAREKIASFKDDILKMESEAATFGKGARAAEIYRMQMEGASAAQIEQAMALDKSLTAMEKHKKLQEKATEVTKKHAAPQLKFNSEQKELKEMLDSGLITLDTYQRALQDVWKEMAKEYKIEFKVGGVDAVAAGSAEAIARAREYLSLRGQMDRPLSKAGQANGAVATAAPPFPDMGMGGFFGDAKPEGGGKGKLTKYQMLARGKSLKNRSKGKTGLESVLDNFAPPSNGLSGLNYTRPDLPGLSESSGPTPSDAVANAFADINNGTRKSTAITPPTPMLEESLGAKLAREQASGSSSTPTVKATGALNPGTDNPIGILALIEKNTRPDPSKPTIVLRPK